MQFVRRGWRGACFLLLLVVLVKTTAAEPFETIINNGDSANRLDIVILGDGYTAAEMTKYREDAQRFFQEVFLQEPYKEYKNYFNVHRIDVVSNQSGADHSDRTPQVFVNTAFDANYNCSGIQRLVCVNNLKVNNVLANTLSPAQREIIIVLVNDPEYGGSGGSIAVASTHRFAVELILHEAGHSFGLLADEYGDSQGTTCGGGFEPTQANATKVTERDAIKWRHWIDLATPIPTSGPSASVPGLYQGAVYCDAGAYRPTFNSKMRTLGQPFEQINTEQHIKRIYNFVSPIDASAPAAAQVTLTQGQAQTFSVARLAPLTHELNVTWLVDNQVAQNGGASFALNTATLALGTHTVQVAVADMTASVRNDPENLLKESRAWNVTINASLPTVQLSSATIDIAEGGIASVTVARMGDASVPFAVNYATADGTASERADYTAALGTLRFEAHETQKTFQIFTTDDAFQEPTENFTLTLSGASGATLGTLATLTVQITSDDAANAPNPVRNESFDSAFFVRQHYRDFLNREPDASGLAFWKNQIDECETRPVAERQGCRELRRINVSAAFFVSTEFQETGYLVYLFYQAAFGKRIAQTAPLTLREFLPDVQEIGRGVVVNVGDWQQQLETNTQAYVNAFVNRADFLAVYPHAMNNADFINALNANAGGSLSEAQRSSLVARLNAFGITRAQALREVAEDADFQRLEKNRAFVLMQYFGYLRRNPPDAPEPGLNFNGYNFWLSKLDEFGGNYINAEMVKAFITSPEYQQRFGN